MLLAQYCKSHTVTLHKWGVLVTLHFHFQDMKNLIWYRRNPKLPTTPNDRCVRKLYFKSDAGEVEMGRINQTKTGNYWFFVTNSLIDVGNSHEYIKERSLEDAENSLFQHVESELLRVMKLNSNFPYILTQKFKRRDKEAFSNYNPETLSEAFKCGMEWILRSEGFPRRPSWATFITQNRDGSFVWHEAKPEVDLNTGVWTSSQRMEKVKLSESLKSSILRLT
jgi:hypothetical protein